MLLFRTVVCVYNAVGAIAEQKGEDWNGENVIESDDERGAEEEHRLLHVNERFTGFNC